MLFPRLVLGFTLFSLYIPSLWVITSMSVVLHINYMPMTPSYIFLAQICSEHHIHDRFCYIEWTLKLIKNDINGSHHANSFLTQLSLFHINKWYHHQTRCSSQNVVVSPLSVSHTSKLFTYLFYNYQLHLHCLSIVKTTLISHLVTSNKVSQTGLSILPSYNLFYFN